MAEDPPPIRSKNRQFVEDCLDNIPFARAAWNFFASEGKAVKDGWLVFILLGIICGWFGYRISEYRSAEALEAKDASIQQLTTQLENSQRSRDSLQVRLTTTEASLRESEHALAPWITLANSKFGNKPADERLPLLFDQIISTLEAGFDKLRIQISQQSDEIKRIPAAVGQTKTTQASSPWVLSEEQARLIERRMAFYAPHTEVDIITCVFGDAASSRFAASLVKALRAAGWKFPGFGFSQALFREPIEGVIVQINSKESVPASLEEFVSILRETGVTPTAQLNGDVPAGAFRILVGGKPEATPAPSAVS